MKTKREVLEEIAKNGECKNINCIEECPYCLSDRCLNTDLIKIGAMAILRMFKEKKKPLLTEGTRIRFENGEEYTISKHWNCYVLKSENKDIGISQLFNTVWEVIND